MDEAGNLVIPQSMIVRLGLAPGDDVHVFFDQLNKQIRLRRPSQLNLEPHQAEEKVSGDGGITLKLNLLKTMELDGLQCYRILSGGNEISVGRVDGD